MNEPIGILIPMLLHALLYRSAEASTNGALTDSQIEDAVDEALETLQLTGMPEEQLVLLRDLFLNDAVSAAHRRPSSRRPDFRFIRGERSL
jgi:hypothetical protein